MKPTVLEVLGALALLSGTVAMALSLRLLLLVLWTGWGDPETPRIALVGAVLFSPVPLQFFWCAVGLVALNSRIRAPLVSKISTALVVAAVGWIAAIAILFLWPQQTR